MNSAFMRKIAPFLSFAVLILAWDFLVRFSNLNTHVLPGPYTVFLSMIELIANGAIFKHTVASLFRVTVGFYIAAIFGIPLGIILGRSRTAALLLNPVIHFLRPISPLAWIPLAMLWFGIGDQPAVFLIFLSSFFPIVVATTVAVQSINPTYFYVAANFDFSRKEVIQKIVIPAIIPAIITALRLTVTIAWIVVVAAEMIAVQSGLGYLILDSRNGLRLDYVMDGMIVIGLIGLYLDYIMRRLGRIDSASWGVRHN
ncbi:MAG: ABC transporter permease [Candidatus Electrothrix sp. AR4]|nr:ABC transporter permease [Candidatus Electrothrix sp. AR4]